MAKYINSPWGMIIGKLFNVIGSSYKGRPYLRGFTKPKQKGTKQRLIQAIKGEIKSNELDPQQINIKLGVFGPLSMIIKENMSNLIYPVWEPMAKGKCLTGGNLFMKTNITPLYFSIPDKNKFFSPKNKPDLKQILITDGILEPAEIIYAAYDKKSKIVMLKWNTKTYLQGKPDDNAHIFIIYWQLKTINKLPDPEKWKDIKLWGDARISVAKREDGKASITLDVGTGLVEPVGTKWKSRYVGAKSRLSRFNRGLGGAPVRQNVGTGLAPVRQNAAEPFSLRPSRNSQFVAYLSFSNKNHQFSPTTAINLPARHPAGNS
ncbi:hypothetical protein KAW65_01315 [candidate division WOR-3 bacterium]|nr:hypothetical protein [candidate division WOR-3 bacterium]